MRTTVPTRREPLFWLGLLVALVLFPLHHAVAWWLNGGDYVAFTMGPNVSDDVYDQSFQYAAGARVFERGGRLSVEDVYELRDAPSVFPPLLTATIGLVSRLTGDLSLTWAVFQATSAALIWAVLFHLTGWAVRTPWARFAIAWAVALVAFGPRNSMLLGWASLLQPLEVTRIASPSPGFLLLLATAWALSRALETRRASAVALAALGTGSLFYVYYFYWVALYGTFGLIAIIAWRDKDHGALKVLGAVAAIATLVGLPYLVGVKSGQSAMQYLLPRVSTATRLPSLPGIAIGVAAFVALWRLDRKRWGWLAAVAVGLVGATGIGLNFQVISGKDAQHVTHFYNKLFQPMMLAILGVISVNVLEKARREAWIAWSAGALSLLLLVVAGYRQVSVARNTHDVHRASEPKNECLLWAGKNLPADSVIATTDEHQFPLVTALAGTFSFVPMGARSLASDDEIVTRYLLAAMLEGKSFDEAWRPVKEPKTGYRALSYTLLGNANLPHEYEQIARRAWDALRLPDALRERRLTHVVSAGAAAADSLRRHFEAAQALHDNGTCTVYRVESPRLTVSSR